jgi:hypothetical protein
VVIDNLDVAGVAFIPLKTDPPLIVQADAVLASAISAEFLQVVSRRNSEIIEYRRRIELPQLTKRHALEIRPELPDALAVEQPLGIPVAETPNHSL